MVYEISKHLYFRQARKSGPENIESAVEAGGPVSWYYWLVPPRWGIVDSVLVTIVPKSYKLKNTWLLFLLSHFILHHCASILKAAAKCRLKRL